MNMEDQTTATVCCFVCSLCIGDIVYGRLTNCNYLKIQEIFFFAEKWFSRKHLLIVLHTFFNLVLQVEATSLRNRINSQDEITECGISSPHAIVEVNVAIATQTREVKRFSWQVRIGVVVCFRRYEVVAVVVSLAAFIDIVKNSLDCIVLWSSHVARATIVCKNSNLDSKCFLIAVLYQHGFHVLKQIRLITRPLHRRERFNKIHKIIFARQTLPLIRFRNSTKP